MSDTTEKALEAKLEELMKTGDMHSAQQVAQHLIDRRKHINSMSYPGVVYGGAAAGDGMSGGGGWGVGSADISNRRQHTLEEMMAMRMRWGAREPGAIGDWAVGFAHMAMHKANDQVHIWIITQDGQSVVLQDDIGLYPSDTLVTKIRLMQRGE